MNDVINEETVADGEVPEKHDPGIAAFNRWMTLFMSKWFMDKNPETAIHARCIMRLTTIPVRDGVPSMAVAVRRNRHVLLYNPAWTRDVNFVEFVATLEHEAQHVFGRDISRFARRLSMHPAEERKNVLTVLNVAADAANNHLLVKRNLHMKYAKSGGWILPEPLGLRPNLDMETYFDLLWQRRQTLLPLARQMLEEMKAAMMAPQSGDEEGDEAEDEESGEGGGEEESGEGGGEEEGDEGGGEEGGGEEGGDEESGEEGDAGGAKMRAIANAMAQLLQENAHNWFGRDDDERGVEEVSALELEIQASMLEGDAKNNILKAVADHVKARGTVPSHIQRLVQEIMEEGVIPWTDILARMINAKILSRRRPTTTRPHKRRHVMHELDEETGELIELEFPEPVFPGGKRERTFCILFAIDTSGSMNDEEVREGLAEIQNLLKTHPDVHCVVVQCDTNISDVSVLGPDEDLDDYVARVGRSSMGGTSFEPPFRFARWVAGDGDRPRVPDPEYAAEIAASYERFDLVVYHTDGGAYAPPISLHPGCAVIWSMSSRGTHGPILHGNGELFGTIIER